MRIMNRPIVSPDFNLEDIRRIRNYNSLHHANMTKKEIISDTHDGAEMLLKELLSRPGRKPIAILSGGSKKVFEAPNGKLVWSAKQ